MNVFDDLSDPQGPPTGDALNAVLARVRRRRVVRRGAIAFLAVVAVVAAAVSANALSTDTGKVHVEGTATTVTAPKPTTSAPSQTSSASTPTTTTTTTTTTTSRPTTPPSLPSADRGVWTGQSLTITPASLGRVRVGMTLDEAQIAAGLKFDGMADGAAYPTLPAGFPHLFVGASSSNVVVCVGAEIGDPGTSRDVVVTPEGFRLGETVQRLQAIYGARAVFSPAPAGGISPRAGYVVAEPAGNLAFYVDSSKTRIFGIKGGGRSLTPSSCNG